MKPESPKTIETKSETLVVSPESKAIDVVSSMEENDRITKDWQVIRTAIRINAMKLQNYMR